MELNTDPIGNGFDLSQTSTTTATTTNSTMLPNGLRENNRSREIENDLFLSLKLHIDSQNKLNQINQSRIRSFERFRKYCQSVTQFGDGTSVNNFDQEKFLNEYNKFDQSYRYWRKRIRKLRKENKSSSLSTRIHQNPYDTLYELFAKIENLDQSKENCNNNDSNQIYPEISINVIESTAEPLKTLASEQLETNRENFNCFVKGCLETKFSSQKDLLDHLFQKHSSVDDDDIPKTKVTRGRKPSATKTSIAKTSTKKQITKPKKTVVSRRSKAGPKKKDKIETKKTQTKRTPLKLESSTDSDCSIPPKKKRGRPKRKENSDPPKVFHCETEGCPYSTSSIWTMNLHKRTHSDERPFQCDKCEKAFKIKGDLKVHQNIHEGRRFECTFEGCTVNYATRKDIRKHIKIFHTKEAPLLHCSWEGCKYSTYDTRCLKFHQTVHTGERQYKCPECEQAFKSRANLWRHKLTHLKEHRYKCDFEGCEYSTNGHELLKSHRMVHFGDRPFKCVWPDCEQAFKTASGLWGHKMIHENQRRYKCTWEGCEYAGNLWGSLQSHVEAVHEKKKKPRIRKRANRNVQTIDPSQLEYPKPESSTSLVHPNIRQMTSCIGPEIGGDTSHSTNAQILLL